MILTLRMKRAFTAKITDHDGSNEKIHTGTQRPLEPDGTRFDEDYVVTIMSFDERNMDIHFDIHENTIVPMAFVDAFSEY